MSRNDDLLARRAAITPKGLPQSTLATATRARGAIIIDADGNELIDFVGGIGVMNAGHCQQAVIDAIQNQARNLLHTCIHVATYEPYVALCERLASLLPHGDATKVLLLNSGAEAVENAVKIARQATNRPAIICYTDAFHGRTLLGMTLSSKVGYKVGCGPFAPEVYRLPFPNYFRSGDGLGQTEFVERELTRLHQTFVHTVAADSVAAIIIEPIQGEGGFVPAPAGYLRGLREICDQYGIKLILDEVQTGFGRTGKWASYEHFGITPDLSTWAKSMSGGIPIAAVIGRADIMDAARPGTVGGTFGGNPVACAAALANIQILEDQNLNDRALRIGEQIFSRFRQFQERCPVIGDVRGMGAMVAMELVEDGDPRKPAAHLVTRIVQDCVANGLLIIPAGPYGNVIRTLCPLTITDEELDRGLSILGESVERHAISHQPATV
jgi:4-aminobutyrate aminotransferase/(S)-3-amino-2-methylpropionate transaminase